MSSRRATENGESPTRRGMVGVYPSLSSPAYTVYSSPSPGQATEGGSLSASGGGSSRKKKSLRTAGGGNGNNDDLAALAPPNPNRVPSTGRLATPTNSARVTTPTSARTSTPGSSSIGTTAVAAAAIARASPGLASPVPGRSLSARPSSNPASSTSAQRRARAVAQAVAEAEEALAARRYARSSSRPLSRRKMRKFEMDHIFGVGGSGVLMAPSLRPVDEGKGGYHSAGKAFVGLDAAEVRAMLELEAQQRSNLSAIVDWRCLFSELFRERNEKALRAFLSCEDAVYRPSSRAGSGGTRAGCKDALARAGAESWARVQNRIRPVVLKALGSSSENTSCSGGNAGADGPGASGYSAAAFVLAVEAALLHFAETGQALPSDAVPRALAEKLQRPMRVHPQEKSEEVQAEVAAVGGDNQDLHSESVQSTSAECNAHAVSTIKSKKRQGKKKGGKHQQPQSASRHNISSSSGRSSFAISSNARGVGEGVNVPGALEIIFSPGGGSGCDDTLTGTSIGGRDGNSNGNSSSGAFDRLLLYATAQFHGLNFKNFETSDGLRVVCVLRKSNAATASLPHIADETVASTTAVVIDGASGSNAEMTTILQPRMSMVAFVHQRYLMNERRVATIGGSHNNHQGSGSSTKSGNAEYDRSNTGYNNTSSCAHRSQRGSLAEGLAALHIASHE